MTKRFPKSGKAKALKLIAVLVVVVLASSASNFASVSPLASSSFGAGGFRVKQRVCQKLVLVFLSNVCHLEQMPSDETNSKGSKPFKIFSSKGFKTVPFINFVRFEQELLGEELLDEVLELE